MGTQNPAAGGQDEEDLSMFPSKSPLYDTQKVIINLEKYPAVAIRRNGKYYLNMKDTLVESTRKVKRDKRTGHVVVNFKEEQKNPLEYVISRFCEDVLSLSRSTFLPLSSQGERHFIWVSKKKASHIIRRLKGNGCYVVNRFPGDIFLKDKQVMGVVLSQFMMMRDNVCLKYCGKNNDQGKEAEVTYRPCEHMVKAMRACCSTTKSCEAANRRCCKHLEFFIPEVQSFCTYNALQNFSNRLREDLKGLTFVCKPAYLSKGNGIRFLHNEEEFKEFYHMTEGKETSRHDFMVQRLVSSPLLYNGYKFDIRAFLLVIVLRFRRVVSFVHYGFCRRAAQKYDNNIPCCTGGVGQQAAETETTTTEETEANGVVDSTQRLERHQQSLLCAFQRDDALGNGDAEEVRKEYDDRSMTLETIFQDEQTDEQADKKADQPNLKTVTKQIKNIAKKVTITIEKKVWDWFGCFQIFSMDLCVQDRGEVPKGENRYKVWLLEINSHALSQVDTTSQTQRKIVPAVLSETIALVVESQFKSFHNMRLRSDPGNAFEVTGLLCQQNYDLAFDTEPKKLMDYKPPKQTKGRQMPYYLRIDVVDRQMKAAKNRKELQERETKKVVAAQKERLLKKKQNDDRIV